MSEALCQTDHIDGPVKYVTCEQCGRVEPLCRDCGFDIYGHWPCDDTPPPTREPIRLTGVRRPKPCWCGRMDEHDLNGLCLVANRPDPAPADLRECHAFDTCAPAAGTEEGVRLTDAEIQQLIPFVFEDANAEDGIRTAVESILAARLAEGPTLADAWDEGYTNGYRLAESYLTRPDGTHVLPTNPYRTPESEDTE